MLEHIKREIRLNLPDEPPPGSVVLTTKGVAYQRERSRLNITGQPATWHSLFDGTFQRASYWTVLLATEGPLYVLTDEASFEWVKRQKEGQGRGEVEESP